MEEGKISSSEYIRNILIENCGFQLQSKLTEELTSFSKEAGHPTITCLEIPSPRDAIILATYSGCFFLLDKESRLSIAEPLQVMGCQFLMKEPISVLEPSFVELPLGPFAPQIEWWKDKFPSIFEGEKKLLLIEKTPYSVYNSGYGRRKAREWERWFEEELLAKLEEIGPLTDFLIQIIPPPSYGELYVSESFFEFMAGVILRQRGYLVTFPILTGGDLVAFKSPQLFEDLQGTGAEGGAFLVELLLNKIFGKVSKAVSPPTQDEAIVIEAESTPTRTRSYGANAGFGQASKYLEYGKYNGAYVTGPLCEEKHESIGTISFQQNGKLFFKEAKLQSFEPLKTILLIRDYIKALL